VTAFKRTLPFSEAEVLRQLSPYLKRSLNLVDVDIVLAEEVAGKDGPGYTKHIIELAEPGNPSYEFMNV
jgi:leucyl-tRNA synthetase